MLIEIIKGDITKIKTDAIINAANTSLLGGGGVDGAIHRAGGKEILEECVKIRNKQGGCAVGEAVFTTAGKLDAKYVIHTVGPRWNNGKSSEANLLKTCYLNILKIAEELRLKSIAIPNISTGIYRYPKSEAADIALQTITDHSASNLEQITFVCFDEENYSLYQQKLESFEESSLDLEEIEYRLHRTTGGNWKAYIEDVDHESGESFVATGLDKDDLDTSKNRGKDIYLVGGTSDDIHFVAHAKKDIRRLIDEVRKLRKKK